MELTFRELPFQSPGYLQTVILRDEILRIPLGLKLTPDEIAKEGNDIHLAAFGEGHVMACLVLTPQENGSIRMRQVAVREGKQGAGVGRKLVEFSETVALAKGYPKMILHARAHVVGFYLKLGYQVVGEEFEEVGIPHFEMGKELISINPA